MLWLWHAIGDRVVADLLRRGESIAQVSHANVDQGDGIDAAGDNRRSRLSAHMGTRRVPVTILGSISMTAFIVLFTQGAAAARSGTPGPDR